MEPCLVWFPTCPCMWLSIASGPPQRSLRVGCSFYGYCSARGRAVGWMLGLAGPASPSGSARKLDREPVRAGAPEQDKEGRESKEGKLGSCRVPGVAPNRFASEQASERDGKGGETKKKKKRMMRKLQFWCGREGDICCSISGRRIGDLNTWKFKLLPEPD